MGDIVDVVDRKRKAAACLVFVLLCEEDDGRAKRGKTRDWIKRRSERVNWRLSSCVDLRWLGLGGQTVKNLRWHACKFDLDQSERKSSQVNARKSWPNGIASRRKFSTFTAVHKDEIDAFHDHLNKQNADIQFTKEIEENGKLPFGKPRQQRTANDSVQKTDAYRQITWRIILQPNFTQSHDYKDFDSLRDENKYLERVFHKNNHNADFIRRNIYRPAEADATNRNSDYTCTLH